MRGTVPSWSRRLGGAGLLVALLGLSGWAAASATEAAA